MGDRHYRNWRKAKRRRDKLLAYSWSEPGYSCAFDTRDFGNMLTCCIQRESDGYRYADCVVADRLWRHMDDVPPRMIGRLLAAFRQTPENVIHD